VPTALASNADSLVVGDFIYKIETDSTHYHEGSVVQIAFTITYTGSEPRTVQFTCAVTHSRVRVYDTLDSLLWVSGCLTLFHDEVMQPGQSIVDVYYWDIWNYWTGEPAPPGMYRVLGFPAVVNGSDYKMDIMIEVLGPPTGIRDDLESLKTSWQAIKSLFR
jgi:hypothetical protein